MNWISVKDKLPSCNYELHETGDYVSNVVMVHDVNSYEFNMGFGHVNDDGIWTVYDGEHDFMNVQNVTHWMPLPKPPKEEKEEG